MGPSWQNVSRETWWERQGRGRLWVCGRISSAYWEGQERHPRDEEDSVLTVRRFCEEGRRGLRWDVRFIRDFELQS